MPYKRAIGIYGAKTHNLKDVTCHIPHGLLTVITGPSGSGKSSLAFDTLYAEGQRRFLESMSTYARQFLERLEKPDVRAIEHILPALALEQKNSVKNARSTVGTATEIDDYLRVLLATLGSTHCVRCGDTVSKATPERIAETLRNHPEGTKVMIAAPVFLGEYPLPTLVAQGYFRFWEKDTLVEVDSPQAKLSGDHAHVVIDRLILKGAKTPTRLEESLRKALALNPHQVVVITPDTGEQQAYHTAFVCQTCKTPHTEPFPNMLSFNNALGACPACEGFGRIIGLDYRKIIPNRDLSLEEGAIHPFNTPSNQELLESLLTEAKKRRIRTDIPFSELLPEEMAFVMNGSGRYEGVKGFFDWLETKKYKVHVRVFLAKYRGYAPCPQCNGARLRPESLAVKLQGYNIHDIGELPVSDLIQTFKAMAFSPADLARCERLLTEIHSRLDYLNTIGLGYLSLNRQSRTLSGGESQRIHLSRALGSALTETLYVLDEPTVGLHARDTLRLLEVLKALKTHGNTVCVVEHDPDMMRGADYMIEMGPVGGHEGGYVVYEGDWEGFLNTPESPTRQYLESPPTEPPKPTPPPKAAKDWFEIQGARGNNLQNLSVKIPKNRLVGISGVSGSGKSTLIKQTLYAGYQHAKGEELTLDSAPCDALLGLESFEDVVLVDQSPPGRSVRSNPVTYVKAYDEIRKLFAAQRKAQALGITPGHFSFNTPGGRCETCEGLGTVTIDMQFMADVTVTCPDCEGKRFSPAVLAIDIAGKTITDVLNMTVHEAMAFFDGHARVSKKLQPLVAIGLGYLHLGQSTSTLSGGEAQRLKLAAYLSQTGKETTRPTLFLFDEPTTGLHLMDIHVLIGALRALVTAGHSVVVVEHNIELLAHTDYLIDLGPEGGDRGGQIVAQGCPDQVAQCTASQTAPFLQSRLNLGLTPTR